MWLRQCRVPVKCCRTGGWIRPTILFYRDSLQYFFVSSIYIFGRVILKMVNFCISWSILSWLSIEILRDLKCDCANVECRLNAVVLEFYRDSLQHFLFQSRIYIFRVEFWNRIGIFYISYLWSYRDSQSKSWMSNLMDSSFTRYFVSIFRMEYIYLTEWFRKWWIFYISWSFMIYRDSQSKSWMSNLWWIRRLQNILFQSGVYIYLAEIYLKMVNLLYFVIFILSWFAIEILDVEYLMNCLQNILFRFSKWSIYIYIWSRYIFENGESFIFRDLYLIVIRNRNLDLRYLECDCANVERFVQWIFAFT